MPTHHTPSPALKSTLAALLTHAVANPGRGVTCRLSNSLKVDITHSGRSVVLAISRSSVWPSEEDWRLILRHWPYPVQARPERKQAYGRRYLTARLPAQDCIRFTWPRRSLP